MKFVAPIALTLLAQGTAAKRHRHRQLQTAAPEVIPERDVLFSGPGCYDYHPGEEGWSVVPNSDDVTVPNVPLGFDFTFNDGTSFDAVNINSNGHVFFTENSPSYGDRYWFAGHFFASGEYVIAPFWADVFTPNGGSIKYKSVGDKFVVVWEEVSGLGAVSSSASNTFQVVLSSGPSEDPQICFCYETMEWGSYGQGDTGISGGPSSGFLFASFGRADQTNRLAWNGIGSPDNGLGHLESHSYCFDTDIVASFTPQNEIRVTNDVTIQQFLGGGRTESSPGTGGESESGPAPGTGGDPHITTWTNEHFEYHGQCDLVLAKDDEFADGLGLEVHIRTKLVRYWSYIKNVAIKIGNDILEIEGSADADDAEAHYWINFEYEGELEEFAGFPVTQTLPSVYKRRYTIDLTSKYPGKSIVIELYKEFVRVRFNGDMETFGNTVGLMGNYLTGETLARDGTTVMNDFTEFGDEWQVLPSEPKIFHEVSHPQFPELCIKPEDPRGDRKRRLEESNISIEQAEAACAKSLSDELSIKDCVYDILATQDLDMVGAF